MAIITTHKFDGDGTKREFQVGDSILSKSHCRVWINDAEPDSKTWDLLGSVILLDTAPAVGVENVKIYVSDTGTFPNEYTTPSVMEFIQTNMDDINFVAQNLASALAQLENVSTITGDFYTTYLGSSDVPPTVDGLGNPVQDGAIYYDTTTSNFKVYEGGWKKFGFDLNDGDRKDYVIGTTAGTSVGQTIFDGLNLANATVDVFYNGSKLFPVKDYIHTDTQVELLLAGGCVLDDVIQIYNYRYPVDIIDCGSFE